MRITPLLWTLSSASLALAQWNHRGWGGWHPGPDHNHNHDTAKTIDLSGTGWTLRSQNGSIEVPARVPSQQFLDLFAAGVIGDPLYGLNNTYETWVRDQNWTYSRPVRELQAAPGTTTLLVFQGLDTFTTISFCGKQVGYTQNQWREYVFDVSNILRSCRGTPQLALNFGPVVNITHEISKGPEGDPLVNDSDGCNDNPGSELSCRIYARKEQSDLGWDWSPSLAPAGPWRPISAVQLTGNEIFVNNAAIDIYRKGQQNNLPPDQSQPWVFNASIDFTNPSSTGFHHLALPRETKMQLTLTDASGRQVLQRQLSGVYSSAETITGTTTIDPSSVQQWWPNGMGAQPLYTAKIDIITSNGRFGQQSTIGSVERRVGFRTIVLNLGPITDEQLAQGVAPGANWHFEVNGNTFYAKGANLVPLDVFWPEIDDTKVTQLFTLAVESSMNLIRVWSSGAYLDDWIYDIADEMGILLWSEFEFTSSVYPVTPGFLEEYEAEAYYNVRRINHHPSLALWAGGNELEIVELGFYYGKPEFAYYQQIQEELLIKCVYANTKSISYIPSSTYNGYLSIDFDSVRPLTSRYRNTSGPDYYYNDTDSYNYFAPTLFDFNTYPVGRFADEFGFISMPSIQSWELEAAPDQLYYPSDTVINHNRHSGLNFGESGTPEQASLAGLAQMTLGVTTYLPVPDLQDSRANFRRGSGMPERQLGCLYWQLNDVWAAPTWSSVENTGRQKMLYYVGKDLYSPVIVYPYYNRNSTDLQIWVTSDRTESLSGTLSYQWFDFSGKALSVGGTATIESKQNATSKGNGTNAKPETINFNVGAINTLANSNVNASNAVLFLSVTAGSYKHSQVFHPLYLGEANLQDPGLKLAKSGGNSWTVTATKAVAGWVWLEYDTNDVLGYWSENAFWLNKGESKTVTFTVFSDQSGGQWASTVSVRSVYDNTRS
ncbi:hypothetical protein PRZ48_001326 [Zasmidium cellare]|uniref:Beta-mannosidase A n=1 Tax=Zasmidium cellare TaxID=395010 RepID=A0ABR0F2M3_ZASCE|nr:hypothetical protein PRZ48_001326 [Zasmidium cellare]